MPFLRYTEWVSSQVFFSFAGLFYLTCTHCIIELILTPIMVLFPSLTRTLTSLSLLLDRNSRNRTLFKLCVIPNWPRYGKKNKPILLKIKQNGSPEWKPSVLKYLRSCQQIALSFSSALLIIPLRIIWDRFTGRSETTARYVTRV